MLCSTNSDATAPCVLRVINNTAVTSARLLWVDYAGGEVEYTQLHPGQAFNQATFSTHPWRLRDAQSGDLLCEHSGGEATLTLCEGAPPSVQPGLRMDLEPSAAERPHPEWGCYKTRATAMGIPIKAYDCVGERPVALAAVVVECMLAGVDPGVVAAMCQRGADVAIIGRHQIPSDLPPYRHIRGGAAPTNYDRSSEWMRGLGGNFSNPTSSVGEENLTMEDDRGHPTEAILVHELAHAVMDIGLLNNPLRGEIERAYEAAKAQGLHPGGCYLMHNALEYWAEASQAWFGATVRMDVTGAMTSREAVKARDPRLAALLAQVYGNGPWRYEHTAPQPFPYASGCSDAAAAQPSGAA